jgi:hypothetical protein
VNCVGAPRIPNFCRDPFWADVNTANDEFVAVAFTLMVGNARNIAR